MPELRFRAALEAVLTGNSLPGMHYQPIADLRRGCVVGYEALARFPAPPLLPPNEWFANAQQRGKRMQLEAITAAMAVQARASLPDDTFLAVNVSPLFLLSPECDALLAATGDLARLVFEITEENRVDDYAALRHKLDRIRTAGGNIAVDDTGSGYASLQHVMELRPHFVKLDRFFVENCHAEPVKSTMIHMLGEAADRIDAWLIAEGIETEHELHELMRHSVPLGQGYYLGRPEADMRPLTNASATSIRDRAAVPATERLQHCLELALSCNTVTEAEAIVRASVHNLIAVVLDEWQRPLQVLEHHPLLGVRTLPVIMRVQIASEPTEVLRRALSRPLSQRFDPVVAIGERGEYQGILRLDRLTHAAIGHAAPSASSATRAPHPPLKVNV